MRRFLSMTWSRNCSGRRSAEEEFDLTWVRAVLGETLRRMEADCRNPAADQPRRSLYLGDV